MPAPLPRNLIAASLLALLPSATIGQGDSSAPVMPPGGEELPETSPGQGEADPELDALLAPYQISIAQASIPLLEDYLEELRALETKLASRADYHGALSVVEEQELVLTRLTFLRERLQDGSSPSEKPAALLLSPAQATLSGSLSNGQQDALASWDTSAHATWMLPAIEPGGYEVRVALALEPEATATSFLLREKFFTLTAPLDPAEAKPIANSSTAATHIASLGILKIRSGDGPLRLELAPDATPPKGMSVLQIQLTPTFAN